MRTRQTIAGLLLVAVVGTAAACSTTSTTSTAGSTSTSRAAAAPSSGNGAMTETTMKSAGGQDLVATAVGAGQFGTLAQALTAAGLVETLQGPGPYTVFAPTDDAFKALPAGTLDELL